jgi:TPR repeat protein
MREPDAAEFTRALNLLEEKRNREAFSILKKLATKHYLPSMLNLGYCYDLGLGVQRSSREALRWYRRAAARGDGSAANNIGCMYRDQRRPRLALRWYRSAVRMGEVDSLLDIAKLHLGPLKDQRIAERVLRKLVGEENITEDTREQGAALLAGGRREQARQKSSFGTLAKTSRTRRRSATLRRANGGSTTKSRK